MTSMREPNDVLSAETEALPELDLTDDDILDAMRRIPGYLDISTEDFRSVYHLAHAHALDRLFRQVTAGRLMRTGIQPLHPETRLDQAAQSLAGQRRKSLPVVDGDNKVVGILTETDFLQRLQVNSFFELLLKLVEDPGGFTHRCHETPVSAAMTAPAVTIGQESGFRAILQSFRACSGRSLPVVDSEGRLRGLLLRKDFINAHHPEALL